MGSVLLPELVKDLIALTINSQSSKCILKMKATKIKLDSDIHEKKILKAHDINLKSIWEYELYLYLQSHENVDRYVRVFEYDHRIIFEYNFLWYCGEAVRVEKKEFMKKQKKMNDRYIKEVKEHAHTLKYYVKHEYKNKMNSSRI